MLVNNQTGAEVDLGQLSQEQNISIPAVLTPEILESLGLAEVQPTLRPTPLHTPGPPEQFGGGWRATWVAPSAAVALHTLLMSVDSAADAARLAVVGDSLRVVEYDRAREQAAAYKAAEYQGTVPPMVASWAINGRTAQQAADNILEEAAAYTNGLEQLRAVRLAAKEQIRISFEANNFAQAQAIAEAAVAAIQAATEGLGNNVPVQSAINPEPSEEV